ncbi:MAG: hypothetical protein K0Q79_3493 [Flavipsychrobacter sp.]|jgi:hypothetical protein|nr:hypothetical protein [Flavipsychrobacter sp.]
MSVFFIYKNKGILIPVYVIVSVLGVTMIAAALHRNYKEVFPTLDVPGTIGTGFLVAALWSYLTKDSYYKDSEGNKVLMDDEHSFWFINMKIWACIFLAIGTILVSDSFLGYIPWQRI